MAHISPDAPAPIITTFVFGFNKGFLSLPAKVFCDAASNTRRHGTPSYGFTQVIKCNYRKKFMFGRVIVSGFPLKKASNSPFTVTRSRALPIRLKKLWANLKLALK